MACAKLCVPDTRLSRIFAFLVAVHRPKMLSPARWTTASNPETVAGANGTAGFQAICPLSLTVPLAVPRTSRTTEHPLARREGRSAAPIGPETPLTRILEFMTRDCHFNSLRGEATNCRRHQNI